MNAAQFSWDDDDDDDDDNSKPNFALKKHFALHHIWRLAKPVILNFFCFYLYPDAYIKA